MKTFTLKIAQLASVAILLSTASFAQAVTSLENVTDSYMYESLIQTEFDIENQMQASVNQTSNKSFQQGMLAARTKQTEEMQQEKDVAE